MKTPAALLLLALVVAVLAAGTTAYARRRGNGGGRTVVRCRDGHLYTIGSHWTMATPVRVDELTPRERELAAAHHDRRVP